MLHKRNTIITLLAFVLILLIGAVFFLGDLTVFNTDLPEGQAPATNVQTPVNIVDVIDEKTFDELKETNPELVDTPNIQDNALREKYLEKVNNAEPANHMVTFTGEVMEPEVTIVLQGDYVSFVNDHSASIDVIGVNGWEITEIPAGSKLTQEFNFIGDFAYSIYVGGEKVTNGTVVVRPLN